MCKNVKIFYLILKEAEELKNVTWDTDLKTKFEKKKIWIYKLKNLPQQKELQLQQTQGKSRVTNLVSPLKFATRRLQQAL